METTQLRTVPPAAVVTFQTVEDLGFKDRVGELALVEELRTRDVKRERRNAERAVHFLMTSSLEPAVLLKSEWRPRGVSFAFEHLALYREIAAASGCFAVPIAYPEAGGMEHLLFAVKIDGLSYQEYLACTVNSNA